MKAVMRRICLLRLLLLLCIMTISVNSQENSSSIPAAFLAHPALFGQRWTPNVSAYMHVASWDLCNETIGLPEYIESVAEVDTTVVEQKLDGVALYFDPFERSGTRECRYATMAQVAEKKYPTAQYLLVRNTDLVPMTKINDEPNVQRLALGTVTVDVGNGMANCLGRTLS